MNSVVIALGFLVGIILGSFIKALADRSLSNKSYWGRSYCPKCKKQLQAYDLFPVLSYLLLRGRCRYCHKKIGIFYLINEIIFGCLVGYLFYISWGNFPGIEDSFALILFVGDLLFKAFFISILGILTITDLKEYFIPDRIIIPAIKIAFVWLLSLTIYRIWYLHFFLSQSDFGKLLLSPDNGYFYNHAVLILQAFVFSVITGIVIGLFFLSLIVLTKGKGMGGGDLKLGAFMGLCLGFPNGVLAVMLGFLIGAVSSILLVIFGKKGFKEVVPFGPFLVLGSLIALFWGNQIINWYLHLSI